MDVQDAVHEATHVANGQSNAIKDITFGSVSRIYWTMRFELLFGSELSLLIDRWHGLKVI